MREALRQRYQLVHIASHFKFQPGNETDSFLLLGAQRDNKLTLAEIKRLSFEGVDLLTLSACETALGGEKANGVEVESLGVLAQRQGAEAVMATLWPVADVSTPLLMRDFYQRRETERGLPKAEALRRAQLSLLTGTIKSPKDTDQLRIVGRESKSKNKVQGSSDVVTKGPYSHPYYWAPFILVGNWK
jgi:CHAT domain-containing protein